MQPAFRAIDSGRQSSSSQSETREFLYTWPPPTNAAARFSGSFVAGRRRNAGQANRAWSRIPARAPCPALRRFRVEYFLSSAAPARTRTGCAIAGVFEGGKLSATATSLNKACGRRIAAAVGAGDIAGKLGETLLLSRLPGLSCDRVLLVGLGAPDALDLKRYRRAVSDAAAVLKRIGARDAINYLALERVRNADVRTLARHAAEALEHTLYRFTGLKTGPDRPIALVRFGTAGERATRKAIEAGL